MVRLCGSVGILKRSHFFFFFLRNSRRVWKPVGRITRLLASKTRAGLREAQHCLSKRSRSVSTRRESSFLLNLTNLQKHPLKLFILKSIKTKVGASCCGLGLASERAELSTGAPALTNGDLNLKIIRIKKKYILGYVLFIILPIRRLIGLLWRLCVRARQPSC